jgi:hypothetical protein
MNKVNTSLFLMSQPLQALASHPEGSPGVTSHTPESVGESVRE